MPSWRRPSRASRSPTPDLAHQVDGALLEHAGAHALDDVLLAAILEDDRIDAAQVQQMAEHQSGRSGADDADLGAREHDRGVRIRAVRFRRTRGRPLLLLDRPLEAARQQLLIDGVVPRVVAVAERRAEDARAAVVADPRERIFLLILRADR